MKKILALVFILMLSVSSICSTFEQPDPDRWFWIGSDDKIGFWLDAQTMEFEKEYSDRITRVWVLTYTAKDDTSTKSLWEYNLDKKNLEHYLMLYITLLVMLYTQKKYPVFGKQ